MSDPPACSVRPIEPRDAAAVARIIRTVMPEHGACGPGFAVNDPEVDAMFDAYQKPRCAYFVVVRGDEVVGGGGIAPLEGGDGRTCELRKMYFLSDVRGRGLGLEVLRRCLDEARRMGFGRCYLETLTGMDRAQRLYERMGFTRLERAEGATGHFGCDRWYSMDL